MVIKKAQSGMKILESLINRLVIYTFGSSFVIAVCTLAALAGAAAALHSQIYALADFLISKSQWPAHGTRTLLKHVITGYFNCLLALRYSLSLRTDMAQNKC